MRLNHIIASGFLLLLFLFVVFGYISLSGLNSFSYQIKEVLPENIEKIKVSSHFDSLAQFILYYDEVLTMSARNYAFTSDAKWKERYDEIVPKLDENIKEAIEKGDQEDKTIFSTIDSANIALVEMEVESMSLVESARTKEAIAVLESDEYWKQKAIYKKGLEKYLEKKGQNLDETLETSTEGLEKAIGNYEELIASNMKKIAFFLILAILVSLMLTVFISKKISKPITNLGISLDGISRGQIEIEIQKSDIYEIDILIKSLERIMTTMKRAIKRMDAPKEAKKEDENGKA